MKSRVRSWVMAAILVMGLSLGLVPGAAAQTGPLPTIKTPASSRFDLKGTVTAGSDAINITGSGAQTGDSAQLDLELTATGTPEALAIHIIETGQKLYLRLADDPQWQYLDLTQGMAGIPGLMPGGMPGMVPGLPMGLTPEDLAQLLQAAVHVHTVGKESILGAPTTKYQVDIDVAKLAAGLSPGTPVDPQTQQILASAKFMLFLWVGDGDQYLHQFQLLLSAQAPDANNQLQTVSVDLTLTFRDFDAPITITAPANAVPISLGGTPVIAPPVIAPPNPAPGMPRTGAPAAPPLPLLLALGLGLACLGAGLRLRRVACAVPIE